MPSAQLDSNTKGLTLFLRAEVEEKYVEGDWQRSVYDEFREKMVDRNMIFPCVYATAGYKANDHRYVFLESSDPSSPANIRILGPAMRAYLKLAHSLGSNTSLVIMCAESDSVEELDVYTDRFWKFLRGLRIYDQNSWPSEVPTKTTDKEWTFCYAGESVFPIALTPAHKDRRSRHSRNLIIAMQPKWVIDQLLATPEKRESAQNKVRALIRKYDVADVSGDLTAYGAEGSSESRQLVLSDDGTTNKIPYEDLDL